MHDYAYVTFHPTEKPASTASFCIKVRKTQQMTNTAESTRARGPTPADVMEHLGMGRDGTTWGYRGPRRSRTTRHTGEPWEDPSALWDACAHDRPSRALVAAKRRALETACRCFSWLREPFSQKESTWRNEHVVWLSQG